MNADRQALHDAALAAALAERARAVSGPWWSGGAWFHLPLATDDVIGRCVEAVLAVVAEAWDPDEDLTDEELDAAWERGTPVVVVPEPTSRPAGDASVWWSDESEEA